MSAVKNMFHCQWSPIHGPGARGGGNFDNETWSGVGPNKVALNQPRFGESTKSPVTCFLIIITIPIPELVDSISIEKSANRALVFSGSVYQLAVLTS